MERKIKIKIDKLEILAQLNDSRVAKLIWESLPIKASIDKWGDEIYFPIPVKAEIDTPRDVVEKGDLGYWPEGHCFCIFYGLTPVSTKDQIKPASSVEIVGKISGDPEQFKKVGNRKPIILERTR
ncbi:MAG: cyclophilin-like fold protein [bacterium]